MAARGVRAGCSRWLSAGFDSEAPRKPVRPPAIAGSSPSGDNPVVPMPNAPAAIASSGGVALPRGVPLKEFAAITGRASLEDLPKGGVGQDQKTGQSAHALLLQKNQSIKGIILI